MSYLNVKNPESVDVRAVYRGQKYEILAGETRSYPEDAACFLLETYGFLVKTDKKDVVVEETMTEDVEVVEADPAPKTKKVKK